MHVGPAAESPQDSERPFADFGDAARRLAPSQEIAVCSVDISYFSICETYCTLSAYIIILPALFINPSDYLTITFESSRQISMRK